MNMDYEILSNTTGFDESRRSHKWTAEEQISIDSWGGWVTKTTTEDERIQVLMFDWYDRTTRDRLKDPDVQQWYLRAKPGTTLRHDKYYRIITQPLKALQENGVKVEALDLDMNIWQPSAPIY